MLETASKLTLIMIKNIVVITVLYLKSFHEHLPSMLGYN